MNIVDVAFDPVICYIVGISDDEMAEDLTYRASPVSSSKRISQGSHW